MKIPTCLRFLSGLSALSFGLAIATAADASAGKSETNVPQRPETVPHAVEIMEAQRQEAVREAARELAARTMTIDFRGGTVGALIAAMKESGIGLNILAESEDLRVEMPAFSIYRASIYSFATALDGLLQPRGYRLQGTNQVAGPQIPVYYLRKLPQNERPPESQFQPFNLTPYLSYATVDDIVGAIRAAWELDPARAPAALRIKFHPTTGILLVSGPPQGIQMTASLLHELRRSEPEAKPGTAPAPNKK